METPNAASTLAFSLPPLPFAENALEPHISARTMSFHYGKHHKAYVDKLNDLVKGSPLAKQPLAEVVRQTADAKDKTAIFNNAAQAWNHEFFWKCLQPGATRQPAGQLATMLNASFKSTADFKQQFVDAAVARFGSGWSWLVADGAQLRIVTTANADTPIAHNQKPLLVVDVWEHAYYLDYQNRRKDFVAAVLDNLVNWDFVAQCLAG